MLFLTWMLSELGCSRCRGKGGGRTVVIVTHDHDVAARAERVVRTRDGRVLEAHESLELAGASPGGSS